MLTEVGQVVAIDSDGLWVETLKQSACSQCRAKNGCGQKLLSNSMSDMTLIKANFYSELKSKKIRSSSLDECAWHIGDKVEIGIEENALVLGALSVYLLPIVLMMIFAYFASYTQMQDGVVALSGLVGLLAGGLLVKSASNKLTHANYYNAVVIGRVLPSDDLHLQISN